VIPSLRAAHGLVFPASGAIVGYLKNRPALPTYPPEMQPKIDRICLESDIVCDTNEVLQSVSRRVAGLDCGPFGAGCVQAVRDIRTITSRATDQHLAYPWAGIGAATGRTLPPAP
jgi:hypothetical protein